MGDVICFLTARERVQKPAARFTGWSGQTAHAPNRPRTTAKNHAPTKAVQAAPKHVTGSITAMIGERRIAHTFRAHPGNVADVLDWSYAHVRDYCGQAVRDDA